MKINVLKKRSEFVDVSRNGHKLFFKDLIVQYKRNDNLGIRIGYTASRKVGGAVCRNRAKRRMRAAVFEFICENNSYSDKNYDIVFISKSSLVNSDWNTFLHQVKNFFEKIK